MRGDSMKKFIVQVDMPLPVLQHGQQFIGQNPKAHFSIEASSPDAAISAMQLGPYKGMPMRTVIF
jgi:hypothetical protein